MSDMFQKFIHNNTPAFESIKNEHPVQLQFAQNVGLNITTKDRFPINFNIWKSKNYNTVTRNK